MQDTSAQHTHSSTACNVKWFARALQVLLPEPPAWLQEPALERGAGWALRAAALLAVQTAAATVPLLVWNLVAAASGAGLTCARVCSPAAPSRPRSTTQPLLVLPGPFARRATRLRKGAPRAGALAWRRCCQSCMAQLEHALGGDTGIAGARPFVVVCQRPTRAPGRASL